MATIFLDDTTAGLTYVTRFTASSDGKIWNGTTWETATTLTDEELEDAIEAVTLTAVLNESSTHIGYLLTVPAGIVVPCHVSLYLTSYTAGDEEVYGCDYDASADGASTPVPATGTVATTYDTLRYVVGLAMGLDTDTDDWTADQAAVVDAIVKSGLRRFYYPKTPDGQPPHEWSFLRKTGTITLAAADYDYDLPTDFVSVVGYPVVDDPAGGRLDMIPADDLIAMRARRNVSGMPAYWAVRPKANVSTVGTRYEMLVYPTPSVADTLTYGYVCEPPMIDATNLYPLGGVTHGETIQAAVLSSMENIKGDYSGVHTQAFSDQLIASVRIDQGQRP